MSSTCYLGHGVTLETLSLLTLLDLLQCFLDCAARFVFEFGVANQPLIESFFRPEEVDHPSTTAQEKDGRSRFLGYYFSFFEDDTNPSRALWRGIIDRALFICEFATDQQHRIERSINTELPPAVQAHIMKDEIETRFPLDVTWHHAVAGATSLSVFR